MSASKKSYFLYSLTLPFVLIITVAIIAFTLWSIKTQPQNPSKIKSQTGAIIIDHNSVALFEQIPDQYIEAAKDMKVMFADRSVGWNIHDYLTCLSYASDEVAPSRCKRTNHLDPAYSTSPSEVNWSRAGGYPRYNWQYYGWPGTGILPELPCGVSANMWNDKNNCFITYVDANPNAYDVYSYQFSYLEVDIGSDISDPVYGFLVSQPNRSDVTDFQALESRHPDKKFIYWTTSLARGIGTSVATDFNNQLRSYALANNKVLFDVADIEAYDPGGNPCYDNRDGVAYRGENYPNDGLNTLALCPHYTTELYGGHLGSVSTGGIRIAKAFWVMMAQLAGWNPGGGPLPSFPVTGPPPASYETTTPPPATPTPTPTPIPTATPVPPQGGGGGLVYHLNFDNEGTFGDCTTCTRYNTSLTSGILGSAFDFNGTSSYIDANVWSYIKGKTAFTFSAWVKPDFEENDVTRHYVVADGSAMNIFNLTQINGWRVLVRFPTVTARADAPNLNWTPGTWHQIAVTYNGSSLKLYWDGQLKGSNPASGAVFNDTMDAQVGRLGNMYWDGAIDQLKIFNYGLSDAEVQSLFANP